MDTKKCSTCEKEKSLDEFYKSKIAIGPICKGRQSQCKECYRSRDRRIDKSKSRYTRRRPLDVPIKKGGLSNRERHLRYDLGIELSDYEKMFKKQRRRCAICGSTNPGHISGHMSVDHDHETKAIRSLLCSGCNLMIGHSKESPTILRLGAEYLESYGRKAIT